MGLIIKSTAEKKIKILGTEIELPQVYARIDFAGRINGVQLEIATPVIFTSKEFYLKNQTIATSIEQTGLTANILPEEKQSVETALKYAKQGLEQLGYEVELAAE